MNILALLNQGADSPEWKIGVPAIMLLGGIGVYALVRWIFNGPPATEPWDEEVNRELANDEAVPLCHRCLTPHPPAADFCPQCGATVGQYTNWLPYPYIFSVGDTLRLGTAGQFHRTRLTVLGFVFLALAEYTVFAPFYLALFFLYLVPRRSPPLPPPTSSTS